LPGLAARCDVHLLLDHKLGGYTQMIFEQLVGEAVSAFSYPIVPHGKERLRAQVGAAHTSEQIKFALKLFAKPKDFCPCLGEGLNNSHTRARRARVHRNGSMDA
jgi:hypothetical protein